MRLITIGLNHKTAPLHVREKLSFSSQGLSEIGRSLLNYQGVNGVVGISTCNRTEIYIEAHNLRPVLRWLQSSQHFDSSSLKPYGYVHIDNTSIRHLMRVASGLDSLALGEVQILGQLKEAYQRAVADGLVSNVLGRLFQVAFAAAKKVRTSTAIGVNPVSVAYLAVKLAQRVFSNLSEKRVLVVGAGDTAQLVVKHFISIGVKDFIIANRSEGRSREFAEQALEGVAVVELIELALVPEYLARVDIVVTATGASLPLVGKGMVERAMLLRKQRAMFMIDLAVPRNIELQVKEVGEVYLYGVDDLRDIAAEHWRGRYSAIGDAEGLIAEEVAKFAVWLRSRRATSTIQAFRRFGQAECRLALEQAQRQIVAGQDAQEVLQRFAHNLLNRLMHIPTVQARRAGVAGNFADLDALERLFKIENIG